MKPRVVVLVLSYNDARTVAHAVRSVVDQPRVRELHAVVLADDASGDDTILRARAAAGGAMRLTLLPARQNQGQWRNLNHALRQLAKQCDWALILHADDVAAEGWLDAIMTRIAECAADVASISTSWDMLYEGHVDATGERAADGVRLIPGSTLAVHDTLLNGCWWKISGAAVRLQAFLEVGDFDPRVPHSADWDWSMRALSRGWSFEYIPRAHTLYRQHAGTISTASLRNDVDILDALTVFDRFGYTLDRREALVYHLRRGKYALHRLGRGLLHGDRRRITTSLQTFSLVGRHLFRQLAA